LKRVKAYPLILKQMAFGPLLHMMYFFPRKKKIEGKKEKG